MGQYLLFIAHIVVSYCISICWFLDECKNCRLLNEFCVLTDTGSLNFRFFVPIASKDHVVLLYFCRRMSPKCLRQQSSSVHCSRTRPRRERIMKATRPPFARNDPVFTGNLAATLSRRGINTELILLNSTSFFVHRRHIILLSVRYDRLIPYWVLSLDESAATASISAHRLILITQLRTRLITL